MKKAFTLFAALFFAFGIASAQDVYFSGHGANTGKIWKNNTLVYSMSDTTGVIMTDMKVANDSTIFSAGRTFSDLQSHVWMNDSVVFTAADSYVISCLAIDANGWTAAGDNKVWQNGEILYEYSIDSNTVCNLYALAVDNVTGDIYTGGSIVTPGVYACVWKNDTILWQCDGWSEVNDLYFDGNDLYAAGFMYGAESIDGVVWQNDSIIFQIEGGNITKITAYNGSLYWAGVSGSDNTAYIWQDSEVLYSHVDVNITALNVNEFGVYYATANDSVATLWKDGEVLYQPEACESISSICVLPTPPVPTGSLTVMVNDTLMGYVVGGGSYPLGDTVSIEAVPNAGYEFLQWHDSITDNPRDILFTQDTTFTAYFGLAEYTITTAVTPEGTGTVTGAGTYPYGDTIELVATPILGYAFISWNDGNVDNPRTIIVTESQTFTAQFGIRQHVVNTMVMPNESGTVIGGGTYNYGDTITLTAQNNTGYIFKMWSDEVLDNPRQVVVDRDTTYTAVFAPLQYTITTGSDPEEGGVVEGGGSYPYGEPVTLTARPANNYSFLCWNDGITSNPRNIIVTGDATYKALFRYTGTVEYLIKLIPSDASMGTVDGEGQYPAGSVIEIKAVPFEHAQFVGWDDGNTDNPRTLVVNSDMILTAIFEPRPMYTITVTSISNTMGTVFGGGTFYANTEINIGAIPYEGFHFAGWQDGEMSNPRTITVTEDAEYIANFSQTLPTTYTVTVHYLPEQGYILGAGSYIVGTTATLVAIPKEGYVFAQWSDGVTDETRQVFVDHDIELSAFFSFTDVEENDAISISLYPNPASDVIRIEGTEGIHDICIFNLTGQVVKTATIQGNEEIHIDDLPAGLYLIRIDSLHAIRFIKENK